MDDLERYIEKRKQKDHQFPKNLEEGFKKFKIEVIEKQESLCQ